MSSDPSTAADTVIIRSADGTTAAEFIPSTNLVCSDLSYDGASWLDPVRAQEAAATGKDYGISLVHPWAGRLERFGYSVGGTDVTLSADDDHIPHSKREGLPIHGVESRFLNWQVETHSERQLVARLLWDDERLLAVFPFPHELRVDATVDAGRVRIQTELRPTADIAVPVTFGYHAFLRIPDSARAGWRIRLDAGAHLLVDEAQIPSGATTPVVESEFVLEQRSLAENLTELSQPGCFEFSDGLSTVAVELEGGYTASHVFAPADRDLVSFEPMTAPANALNSGSGLRMVDPGQTFRASFAVKLSR